MTTVLVVGLVLGNVFVASAQVTATTTSASALQALIQTLQKQIESLTAQLQTLQRAQTQLQTATTTAGVVDALQLIGQLREGSQGEKVRLLQALLAADTSIYPEGMISGYYGRLTAQAVKRFQKKYELEQVGNVGKKTLEKLAKEIEKNPIAIEVRNGVRVPCAIVPPGHLIAPGWLRKSGNVPIIPVCQTIPEGILKKLGLATTTDTVAPRISDIEVKNIAANSAKIEWETNEPATGVVWYGAATSTGAGNGLTVSSSALMREHELVLSGLTASTTYYYVIVSADAAGYVATSSQRSFKTSLIPDTTAPIIANVYTASTTANGTQVLWDTTEPATSVVWYGTSTPVTTTNGSMVSSPTLVAGHAVSLVNLMANTLYRYMVVSTDAAGNTATSSQYSFTTSAITDTTAPTISGVMATSTTPTTSRIVWSTTEPATSVVWYGTSTPVTSANAANQTTTVLVSGHDMALTNLSANTTYRYVVASTDAAGNTATSSEYMFTTPAMPDTTAPIIAGLTATSTTGSASRIVWDTNEMATGSIWYSASTPVVTTGVPAASSATLTLGHDFLLSGLATSTTYYYVAASTDAAGNTATSTEGMVQTLAQ